MRRIPAVMEHTEINPTGGCTGYAVKRAEHINLWQCTECGAEYNGNQLYYLSGDYIADQLRDKEDYFI